MYSVSYCVYRFGYKQHSCSDYKHQMLLQTASKIKVIIIPLVRPACDRAIVEQSPKICVFGHFRGIIETPIFWYLYILCDPPILIAAMSPLSILASGIVASYAYATAVSTTYVAAAGIFPPIFYLKTPHGLAATPSHL